MADKVKKFYKEVMQNLEIKRNEHYNMEERVSYLKNLCGVLKTKYKEDENFKNEYRIKMLTLALFQIEPAILEINTLSEKDRKKLEVNKYELREFSNLISDEIFRLKKENLTDSVSKHENTYWFKIGVFFANGTIEKLMPQYNNNFTKISKHLDIEKGRNYISTTANNFGRPKPLNTTDKNIFSNEEKINIIYKHCIENKIEMTENFLSLVQNKSN